MPRKLIIDTDPGIDDAMAIYLALASPAASQTPEPWKNRPLIDVCVEVEARQVTDLVLERLTSGSRPA